MWSKKTFFWAFLLLAISFLLRVPAFWMPMLDVDEAQFAGFADWLLHGGLPYVSSLDTKPLGIYWFFAAVFAIFGRNNMIAVHLITALWVAITALFCALSARRLYSPRAGFFAALFYIVFTTTYIPKFISTSIVLVMMLPLTVSVYFFIIWDQTGRLRWIWLSGLMWGVASLFKYQAGINLIVVAAYLLLLRPLFSDRCIKWREFLIFLGGGGLVGGLFAIYLLYIGVWHDFIRWSIAGSGAYIGAGSMLVDFWHNLAFRGGSFVFSSLLLWILTSVAAFKFFERLWRRDKQSGLSELLVIVWFLFSILAVCTGGKFYGHYFIQILPAMCILSAGVAARVRKKLLVVIIAGLVIPAVGFFVARVYAGEIYAKIGEEDPATYFPIANYIKENTKEDDTIFVWGFASPIYTLSNRLGASRFLWCDWLTGRVSGTPAAKDQNFDTSNFISLNSWDLFFEDMEKNKPIYFIDTAPGNHHDYGKYPIEKFPALLSYVKENYEFEIAIAGAHIYKRMAP